MNRFNASVALGDGNGTMRYPAQTSHSVECRCPAGKVLAAEYLGNETVIDVEEDVGNPIAGERGDLCLESGAAARLTPDDSFA
jgi:hypothetical protein